MTKRFGIIAFTAFIGFLTLFCVIYEYNLNFEEVLKYLLIAVAIITVLTVAITVCYICSSQIQTMIENKNAININAAETTSLGNYSLRSMNFRSNIAIIQMMERFSQLSECGGTDKPLPTYTKAMVSSFPFTPSAEIVICTPPPPYTVIEMPLESSAILPECPAPPNYDNSVISDAEADDGLPIYSTSLPTTSTSDCTSTIPSTSTINDDCT